jgi:tRNA modification GTPase
LRFIDTAGIRVTSDEIEKLGVSRSSKAAQSADLIIVVLDGSVPLTDEDFEVIELSKSTGKPLITLLNKSDTGTSVELTDAICVSAKTQEGLNELTAKILDLFGVSEASGAAEHTALLSNERQYGAVCRAIISLQALLISPDLSVAPDIALSDAEFALSALGEVTGRNVRGDIIDAIFARFCVGK